MIIAVPTIPLVEQWTEEVEKFSFSPENFKEEKSNSKKILALDRIIRMLHNKKFHLKIIIITYNLFKDNNFISSIKKYRNDIMLIADEVHNLGTELFKPFELQFIKYRLGLSATHKKQFNDEMTEKLINYFGKVVFTYTLEDALKDGILVPYNYYVHEVFLNDDEDEKYLKISSKIRNLKHKKNKKKQDDEDIKLLQIRRKEIIDSAENKLKKFKEIFLQQNLKKIKHTLVFCSDKNRSQLESVNIFLKENNIAFHQITGLETNNKLELQKKLDDFSNGKTLKVLTSMRVLDEGVNIPQINTAFILANTTNKKQWIQRRGRVLRVCQVTNKKKAFIHDFLVKAKPDNPFSESLIKGELKRIREFGNFSINFLKEDGIYPIIKNYTY